MQQGEFSEKPSSPATTMAASDTCKHEFKIRDLSTRSVTLFPTRAQIIRDINAIKLGPGANKVIITGLSPTVDEHSIKVEGTGTATITDVLVEREPNKEIFEDIYPSDDSDDESTDVSDSEDEDPAVVSVQRKIKALNVRAQAKQEAINSAAARLSHCESFCQSDSRDHPVASELGKLMAVYKEERHTIFTDHQIATEALENLKSEIAKLEKERMRLVRAWVKSSEKKRKERLREKQSRRRQKLARQKEKLRIQRDREFFWPKQTYCVTINLEPSAFTPSSSRRTSIDDGDTIVNLATSTFHEDSGKALDLDEISLSLSYITSSASWSPRYDLSLNTTKGTGLLEYGAELSNTTSETWRDAKVILSTSQTNFSGLTETIPTLQPWHVRLLKGVIKGDPYVLMSHHELSAKQREWDQTIDNSMKPRHEIFGRLKNVQELRMDKNSELKFGPRVDVQENVDRGSMAIPPPPQSFGSSLFGSNTIIQNNALRSTAFGSSAQHNAPASGGLFGGLGGQPSMAAPQSGRIAPMALARGEKMSSETTTHRRQEEGLIHYSDELEEAEELEELKQQLSAPAPNSLTFEAGAWGESGMSTTYDVAGTKTLAPSHSAIKHKIAKIDFRNVVFSHIVIGKLRQVAFLKARLRNTSKITLLKGPLGLTLDGSFLGQTQFPRCSAGESFSLPLGVDPSITVSYPKPTVRRSQSGIFNKEDSNLFARTVVITNTKPNTPCEITFLDQVPVSEDERLRIEITSPNGLKVGGQSVQTGTDAGTSGARTSNDKGTANDSRGSAFGALGGVKWGKAVATAKKGGEITWNVKLNPRQSVRLNLEYECVFPGGERVTNI
ncbi:hypothetical protein GLAREA_09522 [Glarea lozoyensis ATCC 20868]|uniref:Mucoidy inhibitor-like protein n=1 Tax=Glarea lozoyensis (strain ATCC 20868 / MF5171) TaxID=1116229 RepID=S3CPK4_GLAL2|nr:uncharacterized protein GLAREA_09522 [Glarea lozoyensis ATCC 20868]EPE28402.1 hypothetical protein GLAREA_09522 [Glarea lozoyensis ATCC 20868]